MKNQIIQLSSQNQINFSSTKAQEINSLTQGTSFCFLFSGAEEYFLDKRQVNLYPHNFLVINSGTNYQSRIDANENVQKYVINYSNAYVNDALSVMVKTDFQLLDNNDSLSTPYIPDILYPFQNDIYYNTCHLKKVIELGIYDDLLLSEYLNYGLKSFIKIYQTEIVRPLNAIQSHRTSTRLEVIKRLCKARDYMQSNFERPISLDDVATYACLSVNHLLRLFKQAYNQSPHQFLTSIRLKRASELIKRTTLSINEIAISVGFENTSAFIRLFKSYFDTTPYQMRKAA